MNNFMEMPSFLESKQVIKGSDSRIAEFFKNRKNAGIASLAILLLAIPLTVWLLQKSQIFAPKADVKPIQLVMGSDSCVVSTDPNKVTCGAFPIKLTSPFSLDEATPSGTPNVSPASSGSPSPSPAVDVISCLKSSLSLSAPLTAANKNNTTLLYWKSIVTLAQAKAAAASCGAQMLNPTNFTSLTLENLVRGAGANPTRSVLVEGPCTDVKVNEYRAGGVKVSADVQCNASDPELSFKVYPATNQFDGIGDFGGNGDPAFIISNVIPSPTPAVSPSAVASAIASPSLNPSPSASASVSPSSSPSPSPSLAPPTAPLTTPMAFSCLYNPVAYSFDLYAPQSLTGITAIQVSQDAAFTNPYVSTTYTASGVNNLYKGPMTFTNNFQSAFRLDTVYYARLMRGDVAGAARTFRVPTCEESNNNDPNNNGSSLYNTVFHASADKLWSILSVKQVDAQSPIASASASATASASIIPSVQGTTYYRVAETEAELADAPLVPYDEHPILTNFTYKNAAPGFRQIWAEFFPVTGDSKVEHVAVEILEPEPVITSLDCSMDVSKQELKLTLNGSRFGDTKGKVSADAVDVQILDWNASQVIATVKPAGSLDTGRLFKVVMTRSDGKILPEVNCQVDTTLIALGARLFCREPGKFDTNGVQVVLVDENGSRVNETVTISKEGLIENLKTKLQIGKLYAVSVKAPYSLRRNAYFTAARGTNVVTADDSPSFILPVGDIAPVILSDGKINTLDRSEIVRQWSVLGTSTKTGDFNRDTKVNSIDWACMRYDFNNEDEAVPARAVMPTPAPTATASPSGSSQASSTPSPSAAARAAYFLLEASGSGTFVKNTEFPIDVRIWSQNEAANLFAAKIGFDASMLEVVRIEKGTVLTSWAEEFVDNQTGNISLVAGKPTPGVITTEGNDPLMARIIFKGKTAGNTPVALNQGSRIYSNRDNQNILTSLLTTEIIITN